MLNPISSTILVIFYVLCATVLVGIVGGLYFAVVKLNALLTAYQIRIEAVLAQAEAVLTSANEKITVIGEKTDTILTHGETLTANVQNRVDKTASIVQRTVNAPFIGANSIVAGLRRGAATFGSLQQRSPMNASVPAGELEESKPDRVGQGTGRK